MLKNLRSIGVKLSLSFSAVVLIFLASMTIVAISLIHIMQGTRQINEETLPYVVLVNEMNTARVEVQQYLTDVSATHNKDGYKDAQEAAKSFLDGVAKYKQMYQREKDAEKLKKIETIEADFNSFYASGKDMAEEYVSKGIEAGNVKMEGFDKSSQAISTALEAFRKQQLTEANHISSGTLKSAQSAVTQMIVSGIVASVLAAILAIWITRGLTGALVRAVNVATRISDGDLSSTITVKGKDETAQLLNAIQIMQNALRSIVAEIKGIVAAANQGDFSTKMNLVGKAGYTKELSDLLNQLINTVDDAFKDTIRVADALAKGDLSQKVTKDYAGAYNQVKVSVNTTADSLNKIVSEIHSIVEAANKGDFSVKLELNGKLGYTKTLSELLNQLSDTVDGAFKDTIHVAQALAQGNLTQTVTRNYQGAFNDVKQNLNETVANLQKLVNEVQVTVDSIANTSKEIASGNNDLSQRTEVQAASLEETAASMDELTSTVKLNAENAKLANQLAHSASSVALKGGSVVQQVVGTMSSINESSSKIVDIISVIDGIAFQTNILALNAAVEAARAGEQGRGFAVVATEVRNLAQRSAAAAKEIKTLIGDSVEKVEVGTKLVDDAGKTMEEIVNAVKRVTDIMSEISGASNEQSEGIEQINRAITQMDEVTQQNAALVEEAAAAAEALEEEAHNLSESVSVFKLAEEQQSRAITPLTSRAPVKQVLAASEKKNTATKKHGTTIKPKAKPTNQAKKSSDDWEEF